MRPLSRPLLLSLLLASAARAADRDASAPAVPQTDFSHVAAPAPTFGLGSLAPASGAAIQSPLALPAAAVPAPAAATPATQAPRQSEPAHSSLIQTLSAAAVDYKPMGDGQVSQAARADFEARAQLGQVRAADGASEAGLGEAQASASSLARSAAGVAFEPGRRLSGADSVQWLDHSGHNWYFRAIKGEPEARAELAYRLDRQVPYDLLGEEIKGAAARHQIRIDGVAAVYRYGSSVWGGKTNKPGDLDVLVVVDGKALGRSGQSSESLSHVDEGDSKSFLMYWTDEKRAAGRLPLNVTVVSREFISEFRKRGGASEELSQLDLGDLTTDWGNAVLTFGDDALTGMAPTPFHILRSAKLTARNAGGFMANFIFQEDLRAPQPMSVPISKKVSEDENNKLIPKIYLRDLEVRLRLATVLEMTGRPAELQDKAVGDPRARFADYFMGREWSTLPKVDRKMVEATIAMNNETSDLIARVDRAVAGLPEQPRWKQWLVNTFLALLILGGFLGMFFIGAR